MPFSRGPPLSHRARNDSAAAGASSATPTNSAWNAEYDKKFSAVNEYWFLFLNCKHGVIVSPKIKWRKIKGKIVHGNPVDPRDVKGAFIGTTFPDSVDHSTGAYRRFFKNYEDAPTLDYSLTEE